MAKRRMKRRGRGEGSISPLPSGNYQAALPGPKRPGSTKTFGSHADALDWIRKNAHRKATAAGTLGEWLDTWLDLHQKKVAPITYKNDRHTIEKHVRPHLATVKLRDLSALIIEQFFATLQAAGVTQNERYKAGKVLRTSLNAAVRLGQLDASPLTRGLVKVPTAGKSQSRALTPEELARLLRAADEAGHRVMFRVCLELGLRPAELTGLRWEDFDPAHGTITIARAVCAVTGVLRPPKTRRESPIPLSDATRQLLGAVRPHHGTGVMFPTARGQYWWPSNFDRAVWRPVCKAAKVKASRYALRHTCASLLLSAGVNILVIAKRLGHAKADITLRIYSHLMPGDQSKAAEVMDQLMSSICGSPQSRHEST